MALTEIYDVIKENQPYDEKRYTNALKEMLKQWLEDMEMELGNAGEHEKRMEFCREVLEMFDWKYDDCDNFRSAIGEEFYATGKIEEGKEWFEAWLEKKPHNENAD